MNKQFLNKANKFNDKYHSESIIFNNYLLVISIKIVSQMIHE